MTQCSTGGGWTDGSVSYSILSMTITYPTLRQDFIRELEAMTAKFNTMDPVLEITLNDSEQDVEGYVVVWNTSICRDGALFANEKGCGKGGTRILKGLSLHDVKRLARAMAKKNAAAGLPLGGAKSGLNCDSNDPDYERKFRRFVSLVKEAGLLYEDGGIFGGFGYDIGGKPPYNAIWACDELGSGKSFTGKPLNMGGTDYDRIGIAGLGVATAGKTALECKGINPANTTFAVQGLGAMGAAVTNYMHEYGARMMALSDPKFGGTWRFGHYASDDVIAALFNHDTDRITSLLQNEAELISDDPSGALYEDADMVFPCAMEDAITTGNANKIHAKFICEGANNPTLMDAKIMLFDMGKILVPDILANPGGIIAAFVEMTSDAQDKSIEAIAKTREVIAQNIKTMMKGVEELNIRPDQMADYMTYMNLFRHES